jgi:regulator of PEP synthase PpsR (kinase-PPPase family)
MKKVIGMSKLSKKQAKKYFEELYEITEEFHRKVDALEDRMAQETGIEDIEFFWADNSICGIGNASRTLPLIQMYED